MYFTKLYFIKHTNTKFGKQLNSNESFKLGVKFISYAYSKQLDVTGLLVFKLTK